MVSLLLQNCRSSTEGIPPKAIHSQHISSSFTDNCQMIIDEAFGLSRHQHVSSKIQVKFSSKSGVNPTTGIACVCTQHVLLEWHDIPKQHAFAFV